MLEVNSLRVTEKNMGLSTDVTITCECDETSSISKKYDLKMTNKLRVPSLFISPSKSLTNQVMKSPDPITEAQKIQKQRHKPSRFTKRRRQIIRTCEVIIDGNRRSSSHYTTNIMFLLSILMNGIGPMEGANTLAMMGLPGCTNYETNTYFRMCKPIYKKVIEVGRSTLEDGLKEELEYELNKHGLTYDEWIKTPVSK